MVRTNSNQGGRHICIRTSIDRLRSAELPESGCDFVLHDVDGEWVMSQECPEFGAGGGNKTKGRDQKAEVRDQRERCGRSAGMLMGRAARSFEQRDTAGNTESPESGWGFVLQDVDGEMVRWREGPEMGERLNVKR
jgi:hypothetical protein